MTSDASRKRVIAGGSGFIGQAFAREWEQRGHDVVILTRRRDASQASLSGRPVYWDGVTASAWSDELDRAEVVLNLCGESIGDGRWTTRRKVDLLNSRVQPTTLLVEAVNNCNHKPECFLQASAVGFYGSGSTPVDESDYAGDDYLAELASIWEAAANPAGVRVAKLRFGVVFDRAQGALRKLLLPFRLGAGGALGSGEQWLSWIHVADLVTAVNHVIDNSLEGPVNITAPEAVTNAEFASIAADVLKRPNWLRTPAFVLQILLGEQAKVVLEGQRVVPRQLLDSGFRFKFQHLDPALRNLVAKHEG